MKAILADTALLLLAVIMAVQIIIFGIIAVSLDSYILGAVTGVCISELPRTLRNLNSQTK